MKPLDTIDNRDALVKVSPGGTAAEEADWPECDAIVGNPPFLGDKKMRGELGDEYVTALRKCYEGRVPGGADLVTYWFEKARAQIEVHQALRGGADRMGQGPGPVRHDTGGRRQVGRRGHSRRVDRRR